METQNLWPDFAVEPMRSPKAILKEQAGFLMEKTRNVLSAEIDTRKIMGDRIQHRFFIVAPALDNYRYGIVTVQHSVLYYPLTVIFDAHSYEVDNEGQFMAALGEAFKSKDTLRVISSLLSQSMVE